jgi:hyperosmotically inducible periplasmic protein
MKQNLAKAWLMGLVISSALTISSCGAKDSDIQTSFAEKARNDARLANISGTVDKGVLTLTGQCPDQACASYAEQTAKETKGVKSVVNNITVTPPVTTAPVEIAPDDALTTGARDAVKDYPGVTATVVNGEIHLAGTIERSRHTALIQSLHSLNAKKINQDKLTIK